MKRDNEALKIACDSSTAVRPRRSRRCWRSPPRCVARRPPRPRRQDRRSPRQADVRGTEVPAAQTGRLPAHAEVRRDRLRRREPRSPHLRTDDPRSHRLDVRAGREGRARRHDRLPDAQRRRRGDDREGARRAARLSWPARSPSTSAARRARPASSVCPRTSTRASRCWRRSCARPVFDQEVLDRYRGDVLSEMEQRNASTSDIESREWQFLMYGDHPCTTPYRRTEAVGQIDHARGPGRLPQEVLLPEELHLRGLRRLQDQGDPRQARQHARRLARSGARACPAIPDQIPDPEARRLHDQEGGRQPVAHPRRTHRRQAGHPRPVRPHGDERHPRRRRVHLAHRPPGAFRRGSGLQRRQRLRAPGALSRAPSGPGSRPSTRRRPSAPGSSSTRSSASAPRNATRRSSRTPRPASSATWSIPSAARAASSTPSRTTTTPAARTTTGRTTRRTWRR